MTNTKVQFPNLTKANHNLFTSTLVLLQNWNTLKGERHFETGAAKKKPSQECAGREAKELAKTRHPIELFQCASASEHADRT